MLDPVPAGGSGGRRARLKAIQADVQELFTTLVGSRRPKLAPNGENLFTGAVWTGRQALALGLVDALGDAALDPAGALRRQGRARLRRRAEGFAGGAPARRPDSGARAASVAGEVMAAIEDRAAWARFGL